MVVFTCTHCGDSVKKTAVEKHYNTKCRGGKIFLTCMDCLKDFSDLEYVAHTKCMSETERYSGKDYVPKASLNKGQKKQDSWIEIIREILVSTDYVLKPITRSVFERLQNYENVPRKRAKFENFVNNSFKINKSLLPEVWGILEKEMTKIKKNTAIGNENGTKIKDNEPKQNGSTIEENEENNEKTKISENENNENLEDLSTEKKKKKKSKKRKIEEEVVETVNEDGKSANNLCVNDEIPEIKKIKKNGFKDSEIKVESETDEKFDWFETISANAKDGTAIEKLKNKVLRKYKKFLKLEEFENVNKVEKTFKKYLKKSGINIENNFVKAIS